MWESLGVIFPDVPGYRGSNWHGFLRIRWFVRAAIIVGLLKRLNSYMLAVVKKKARRAPGCACASVSRAGESKQASKQRKEAATFHCIMAPSSSHLTRSRTLSSSEDPELFLEQQGVYGDTTTVTDEMLLTIPDDLPCDGCRNKSKQKENKTRHFQVRTVPLRLLLQPAVPGPRLEHAPRTLRRFFGAGGGAAPSAAAGDTTGGRQGLRTVSEGHSCSGTSSDCLCPVRARLLLDLFGTPRPHGAPAAERERG